VTAKAGQTVIKQDAGDIVLTFNLYDYDPKENKDPILVDVNVTKLKDKVVDYIFDTIFSVFPFPPEPVNPPREPDYYPTLRKTGRSKS
jgi:hypothetical protein